MGLAGHSARQDHLKVNILEKTGQLVSLSEQNLVDCSQSYGNDGCQGGWIMPLDIFMLMMVTEASYPYGGYNERRRRFRAADVGARDSGKTVLLYLTLSPAF